MWLENFNNMRKASGMSLDELSEKSGVAKGTLAKITSGITKAPTLETMKSLVYAMGYTLADLDDIPTETKNAPSISDEAMRLAKDFDELDYFGKKQVRSVADIEMERIATPQMSEIITESKPITKVIPLFGNSFAAGTGDPDFENAIEKYEVPTDSTADFAIRINGDSMEPYLPDGSIQLCRIKDPLDGEVAALLLDGAFICKQICKDYYGNLHLFSLNRARADADVSLKADDPRDFKCFGTVIMDKHIPLPR